MKLPPVFAATEDAELKDVTALVIPDLSLDPRFKDRPYVTDAPHARFYAGVPIRSPAGHNIGAFCVLDGKARPEGVSDEELAFLKDMAVTVMRHMELVKSEEFLRRMGKMVGGLGAFVEGRGDTPTEENEDNDMETRNDAISLEPPSTTVSSATSLKSSEPSPGSSTASAITTPDSGQSAELQLPPPSTSRSSSQTVTPAIKPSSGPNETFSLKLDVESVFTRAARVLGDATEVDGALFLDASITTFGGLVEDSTRHRRMSSLSTAPDKACDVLGFSLSERAKGWANDKRLTEQNLKGLLQRYPRGKVFDFEISPRSSPTSAASEQLSELDYDVHRLSSLLPKARSLVLLPLYVFDHTNGRPYAAALLWTCEPRRLFRESEELAYLSAFGNSVMAEVARCDAARRDCAKADFISGVSHELRSPLHGILGCVELMLNDEDVRQHPGDGADGANGAMSPFHREMAGTIETCGRTLLDTINHVLDFAKINNITQNATRSSQLGITGSKSDLRRSQTETPVAGYDSDERDPDVRNQDVDLARLVAEVVKTVYAGFNFRKRSTNPLDLHESTQQRLGNARSRAHSLVGMAPLHPSAVVNPFAAGETAAEQNGTTAYGHADGLEKQDGTDAVQVIVDIDDPAGGWTFRTQPGAWRRILMNLFGNSLKYTDKGFIKVKLECVSSENGDGTIPDPKSARIVLTVTDSGRGMSPEYVRDHLFHPFAQEDPLSPGTGLGMSIIKQIVTSMGGRVEVRSEKGRGTEFRVLVELDRSADMPRSNFTKNVGSLTLNPNAAKHVKSPSIPLFTPTSMKPLAVEAGITSPGNTILSTAVASTSANSSGSPLPKKATGRAKPTGRNINVLMVDDNLVNLHLLEAFVKRKGYLYEKALNGLEAVNMFKKSKTPFDFVLMDITMPVMDGLTATRLIRAHEREELGLSSEQETVGMQATAGAEIVNVDGTWESRKEDREGRDSQEGDGQKLTKIVALTGLASQEAKKEAFTSGIDMFITKPVRLAELSRILEGKDDGAPV